jgi:hypothetical protein
MTGGIDSAAILKRSTSSKGRAPERPTDDLRSVSGESGPVTIGAKNRVNVRPRARARGRVESLDPRPALGARVGGLGEGAGRRDVHSASRSLAGGFTRVSRRFSIGGMRMLDEVFDGAFGAELAIWTTSCSR